MNRFRKISIAINAYGKASGFIFKKGFKRYSVYPLLLNVLLLTGAIWLSVVYGNFLSGLLVQWLGIKEDNWTGVLGLLFSWMIRAIVFLIYFSIYKYIILVLLSPFLAFLSEKVARYEQGKDYPFSLRQMLNDIKRSIIINGKNFAVEILLTLAFSLLTFIPLIGLLSPFFILLVQSYYYGFSLMDFNAEREKWSRKQTEKWMWGNFWGIAANGFIFHLCFLIPLVGWALAPVWSTIAGTLTFIQLNESE